MISIKNKRELEAMREACIISARAQKLGGGAGQNGVNRQLKGKGRYNGGQAK